MSASASLRVRVVDIARDPVRGARVRLMQERGDPVDLKLDKATGVHWTDTSQRGRFVLSVSAPGLESQERPVTLPRPPTPEEFVLGKKGLPYYFRGKVKTPFEPKPQFVALTVQEEKDAAPAFDRIAGGLGLVEEKTHEQIRRNDVRLFRYPDRSTAADRQRAFDAIRLAPGVRIAGPVLEIFEQRLVFLTNQSVVKFSSDVTREQVQRIAREHGVKVVRSIAAAGNAFLFEGEPKADYSLLDVANRLAVLKEVEYAEPNAVTTSILYQVNPGDFLAAQQWHIPLINLPDAWQTLRNSNAPGVVPGGPGDRTMGAATIQIVVFDTGIETTTPAGVVTPTHPDFQGNVTSGAPKAAAFYDFVNMVADNDAPLGDHGMGCAGVATALAGNASTVAGEAEGVAGAAGNCRVIGAIVPFGRPNLRWSDALMWMAGFDPDWVADGVTYPLGTVFPAPLAQGVDVHTNSTRIPDVGLLDDTLDFLATHGRGGRGVVSFLAAGNTAAPISDPSNNTIADHEKVITVAASINTDVRSSYSCFDPAIDICAPSSGGAGQPLAPGKVTADTVGGGNLAGHTGGPLSYRNNFGGTSSATPLAAGVGALMLSINPDLTWVQVREVLRNTAVKIDAANTDPVGQWTTDAAGDPVFSQWYGYGRVDAQAAVQGATDLLATDVDTWIRENAADVGDVPCPPPYSPDVWVRNVDPALDDPAQVTVHQEPIRNQDNWVYINVRNRGGIASNDVYARILITRWAGTQYVYPDDFIPTTPPGTTPTLPLAPGTYLIGEVHIDSIPAGGMVTVNAVWPAALIPPATVTVGGVTYSWADACLLVDVSPHDGPPPTGSNTWDNNNLTQKNVFPVDPADSDDLLIAFVVGHRLNYADLVHLRIVRRGLPPGVKLHFDYVDRDTARLAQALCGRAGREAEDQVGTCDLTFLSKTAITVQHPREAAPTEAVIASGTRLTALCCDSVKHRPAYELSPARNGRPTVFTLPVAQTAFVPMPRKKGEYQMAALQLTGLKRLEKGEYHIDIYQETPDGRLQGGINLVIRKRRG